MKALALTLNTAVLYAATLVLGVLVAARHLRYPVVSTLITPTAFGWSDLVLFVLIMAVCTYLMVRFMARTHAFMTLLMSLALVAGAQFALASWLTWPTSIVVALVLVALMIWVPRVWVHDIANMVGLVGIAAVLGLSLTPLIMCVLLGVLSVYDIISVYRTKTMVTMAGNMLASGVVLGFLIPARLGAFFDSRKQALKERSVMLLGSGDIGLPLMLVTATVSQSVNAAWVVAAGALAGVLLMQLIFLTQRQARPMAALPPIAALAVIGYLVAILLKL